MLALWYTLGLLAGYALSAWAFHWPTLAVIFFSVVIATGTARYVNNRTK